MRPQIQQIIGELNQTREQSQNDTVKAICCCLVMKLESAIRPQWVPVADRLPDTPRSVFVIDQNEDGYSIGYYLGGYGWGGCDIYDENVTHWHEIDYPEPPEQHG